MTEEKDLRAILVAVDSGSFNFEYMLDEMKRLIKACEMEVCGVLIQTLANPNPATYIGSGKVYELKEQTRILSADYCIIADNLSPAQLKNLTDMVDTAVLDRTGLILEIFARRAKTREARLQVEAANLNYLLPRLVGMRTSLGRQAGATGSLSNKGRGETQLELDRRHIERRLTEVRRELNSIDHDREVQRALRTKNDIPMVALVGYTNAGKSTLMNRLLTLNKTEEEKLVFEKDMLFATLDTTVRRIDCDDKKSFLLSDTVGFVSDLPHGLVKAFRSTLSEARNADLLLVVLDSSDDYVREQLAVTEDTLKESDCTGIPRIYVYNKCDKLPVVPAPGEHSKDRIYISAKSGKNIDALTDLIKDELYKENEIIEATIPFDKGALLNLINETATVLETDYSEKGTFIKAEVTKRLKGKLISEGINL